LVIIVREMKEISDANFYREAIDSEKPSIILISEEEAPGHNEILGKQWRLTDTFTSLPGKK